MVTLLLLCLFLSSTLATPATSSMFVGRSADLIIGSDAQQDSVILFKGADFSTTQLNKLEDITFADVFAHVMGTQPFHLDADRTGYPTSSLFNKPRAALLVAIDSVGAGILNKYPTLSLLQNAHKSTLTTLASPANTQTILANIATGTTPSKHGIVGASWRRPITGTLVNAYDTEGRSFSANIADILLQETKGRSMVVSASSSPSFASALAAHPELVEANPEWNAQAYSLEDGKVFVSRYEDTSKQYLQISESTLSALMADIAISSGITLSTQNPEDLALLAELAFVKNLISKLDTPAVSALVKDDIPDLYSFVFASLKGIQAKYGEDSVTFAAALSLVSKAADSLALALNAHYDGRVATAVLALNARDVSSESLKQKVFNKVSSLLYSEEDFAELFPAVFVRSNQFGGHARDIMCANLQQAISDFNVNVYCGAPSTYSRAARSLVGINASNHTCPTYDNETTPQEDSDLATVWSFWLNFFITIIIISFVGWGAYCLAFVGSDASKDSLLFRVTGRHHQN